MALNINDVLEGSETTPFDKEISNNLYGLNPTGDLATLQKNSDTRGLVFFTRPQLNLTTKNIIRVRHLFPLLNKNEKSIHRFVRCTLDPRLQLDLNDPYYTEQLSCPLVDTGSAFIPILSNTLMSLTGWPDMVVPTYTTPAGMRKEQISMIDGAYEVFDNFSLNATFENFKNEPLTLLFMVWMIYPSLVFEGMLDPYMDFITQNEFDYNTRIYRFVMDASGRFIKKAAATGASFPPVSPTGKFFDFDRSKPFTDQTGAINITFNSVGALYFDDKVLRDFNAVQAIFNVEIRNYLKDPATSSMEVVPYKLVNNLKYRLYPIVDLKTYELKWLIDKNSKAYKRLVDGLNGSYDPLNGIKETKKKKVSDIPTFSTF